MRIFRFLSRLVVFLALTELLTTAFPVAFQDINAKKPVTQQPAHTGAAAPDSKAGKSEKGQPKPEAKPKPKPKPKQKQGASQPVEQEQQILAEGDLAKACPSGCSNKNVTVVNDNNETKPGELVGTTDGLSIVKFKAPPAFHATKVLVIGEPVVKADGQKGTAPASVLSVREAAALRDYRVAVRGDFRLDDKGSVVSDCKGYLSDSQLNSVNVTVVPPVNERTVVIQYVASSDFVPDTLTLQCYKGGTITVPFTVFRGVHQLVTSFTSDSIDQTFCGGECKDVAETNVTLTLIPADSDATVKLLRLTNGRIWVKLTVPPDYAPQALTVYNSVTKQTVYAKRMLGPVVDSHQPFVTYTIMDSETEKRDFGRRISLNYFAINVQVHNPTTQKIQLNKARIWFDCDYAEIHKQDLTKNDVKYRLVDGKPKKYLFGIDHVQRHFPHTLLQVLGAFDAQTGKEKVIFDGADLTASILSALTGVFDTPEYAVATNIFSGIAVPGFRKIIMNPDAINQKRASLMAQALDTVVQVPSKGAASTLLFLPRKGILGWMDTTGQEEQVPVIIDTIRDIHFEPEVVIDVAASQVQVITVGMTEDQVKSALGDPATRTEQNGTVTYTYSAGPYKQVTFKKDGTGTVRVVSFEERSATEQLTEGKTTIADAEQLLGQSRVDLRDAVDGGKIWVDPPVVGADLRFGKDNVLLKKSYHHASGVLEQMTGQGLDVIVNKAKDLALTDDVKKAIDTTYPKEFSNGVLRIPSPDFAGTFIKLSCEAGQTDNKCKVKTIE